MQVTNNSILTIQKHPFVLCNSSCTRKLKTRKSLSFERENQQQWGIIMGIGKGISPLWLDPVLLNHQQKMITCWNFETLHLTGCLVTVSLVIYSIKRGGGRVEEKIGCAVENAMIISNSHSYYCGQCCCLTILLQGFNLYVFWHEWE